MNFSSDRDLLAVEPNVFRDVPLVAQQRLSVTDGVMVGSTLSSASADFAAAGVEPGGVVLVADVAHEVLQRSDAQTLTVSLPRASVGDAAIPSGDATGLAVVVRTFAPQATLVHDMLLRMLGIDADDGNASLTADAIVSLTLMNRLEALGTLERVYAAGRAITGDNEHVDAKAKQYRSRFLEACRRATVLLDTDGDGRADARRSLGAVAFVRH